MSKYLELFKGAFDDSIGTKTKPENKPYIGYSLTEGKLVYTVVPAKEEPVSSAYVTFKSEEPNSTISIEYLEYYVDDINHIIEYSTDCSNWTEIRDIESGITFTLNNIGDEVYVRGFLKNDVEYINELLPHIQFRTTGKIAASGNCNALWNYQDLNAPLKKKCGYNMFSNCTSLTAAPELPATELADSCYSGMFSNCTSLTAAPELPATELADSCYSRMFSNCTSLTAAPELPATELVDSCYSGMFSNCTSLTAAPELPATELVDWCYDRMFSGCTSLNYIKCLATSKKANDTYQWTNNIYPTGIFVKHPNAAWKFTTPAEMMVGSYGIPEGWTVVDAEV